MTFLVAIHVAIVALHGLHNYTSCLISGYASALENYGTCKFFRIANKWNQPNTGLGSCDLSGTSKTGPSVDSIRNCANALISHFLGLASSKNSLKCALLSHNLRL
jgi:hypothetical protein